MAVLAVQSQTTSKATSKKLTKKASKTTTAKTTPGIIIKNSKLKTREILFKFN